MEALTNLVLLTFTSQLFIKPWALKAAPYKLCMAQYIFSAE